MLSKETIYLDGENHVLIEVLDARSVRLTFKAHPLDVVFEGRKIVGIYVSNLPYLTLNEFDNIYANIADRFYTYRIKHIERLNQNCFLVHTEKRTKASFFLTPLLGESRDEIKWEQYFVNAYTTSDKKLALLFRFFNNEDYRKFEHSLKKHKLFREMKDYDLQHVLVKFDLPEDSDVLEKFTEGKYSKMSQNYKEKILKFHKLNKDSELGKVLFKSEDKRKQMELDLGVKIPEDVELYDIPDEKEVIV